MSTLQPDYAVVLNPNARRVSSRLHQRIGELVNPDHIYVTEDQSAAEDAIGEIVDRGYSTVFAGGGDGTVHQLINGINGATEAPRLGVLPLGTGNAVAEIVSSGDPMGDLRTFVTNPSTDLHALNLCEAEGTRFAFGGVGVDAAVLNDFNRLRGRFGGGMVSRAAHNLGGYFAAAFCMTIPRHFQRWMQGRRLEVRVTNLGENAYSILAEKPGVGSVDQVFGAGEVLYEGPINTAAFGTCPYYGYGMKILPYAGIERNRFHLRLSGVPITHLVGSLRKLWRGTVSHSKLHDFQVEKVRLEFSEPVPYQIAGEGMGTRTELVVGMNENPVNLVRFI